MKICCVKITLLVIFISFHRWHCTGEFEQTLSYKNDKLVEPSSGIKSNQINSDFFSSAIKETYTLHGVYKSRTLQKSHLSNNVKKRPISLLLEVKSGVKIRKSKEDEMLHTSAENVKDIKVTTSSSRISSTVKPTSHYSENIQVSDTKDSKLEGTHREVQSSENSNDASHTVNQESELKSKEIKSEENKEWSDKSKLSSDDKVTNHPEEHGDDKMINKVDDDMLKNENISKDNEAVETPQHTHSEVMPSFDEWKKMMLAEQEKDGNKIQPLASVSGKKIISHKRRHNYASYECGAKIVAVNTEAEGTNHILNEMVDEYMLNPCKVKIWFVIELCESIQVSQIELANFELFSSSPKEFSVSWSDRFPTREWTSLGTITVEDQRTLQGFNLQHQGYGKFIKFELLSHYGTEHYCPISVIRVFGTSMVDEYEEMETAEISHHISEDDDDRLDLPLTEESSSSQDLFGSARDAVINIMKKAAEVLSRDQEQENDSQRLGQLLDTHSSLQIDCERFLNCTTNLTVTDTISMPSPTLFIPYLEYCESCSFRVDSYQSHVDSTSLCQFIFVLFGPVVFENFCKQQQTLSSIGVSQLESSVTSTTTVTEKDILESKAKILSTDKSESKDFSHSTNSEMDSMDLCTQTEKLSTDYEKLHVPETMDDLQKSIQPTKTIQTSSKPHKELHTEEAKVHDKSISEKSMKEESKSKKPPSKTIDEQTHTVISTSELPVASEVITESIQPSISEGSKSETVDTVIASVQNDTDTSTYQAETKDSLELATPVLQQIYDGSSTSQDIQFSKDEIEKYENGGLKTEPIFVGIPSPPGQKESVFMRMGNRIKALELNMSLSSQYLQELSQRYRRQMEDMQKAFNRTIGTLNDTARKAAIRDLHQQEVIGQLQAEITNLTSAVDLLLRERQSAHRQMLEMHICLMIIEAIIMVTVLSLCVRRLTQSINQIPPDLHPSEYVSRKLSSSPHRGRKRSANDTQSPEIRTNYLIVEPSVPIVIEPPPKVKKKHHRNKKKNQQGKCSQKTDSCNFNYFSSLNNCDISNATNLDQKSTAERTKDSVNCENTFDIKQNIQKCREKERPKAVPLQNLTNGPRYNGMVPEVSDDKFGFKKFLKLKKKNSF
ncbi:SUN domain-containing ossification factor isoform X2 [Centruroides vittatus]|uniref:SUN domain-containing ossification factor isoform X2 n=1 Tax=Centruroides vittatus TaxID=120091 RepID=UPI00350F3CC8